MDFNDDDTGTLTIITGINDVKMEYPGIPRSDALDVIESARSEGGKFVALHTDEHIITIEKSNIKDIRWDKDN